MRMAFTSEFMEEFTMAAGRAAFVLAWADKHASESLRGDLNELAPDTPLWALVWAGQMTGRYEAENKTNIYALAQRASVADGRPVEAREFGWGLALMALDTGAGWFDDHKRFALKIPHMEFDYDDSDEDEV